MIEQHRLTAREPQAIVALAAAQLQQLAPRQPLLRHHAHRPIVEDDERFAARAIGEQRRERHRRVAEFEHAFELEPVDARRDREAAAGEGAIARVLRLDAPAAVGERAHEKRQQVGRQFELQAASVRAMRDAHAFVRQLVERVALDHRIAHEQPPRLVLQQPLRRIRPRHFITLILEQQRAHQRTLRIARLARVQAQNALGRDARIVQPQRIRQQQLRHARQRHHFVDEREPLRHRHRDAAVAAQDVHPRQHAAIVDARDRVVQEQRAFARASCSRRRRACRAALQAQRRAIRRRSTASRARRGTIPTARLRRARRA